MKKKFSKQDKDKVNIVLNCGSSSVKYKVFVSKNGTCLAEGVVEKVGAPGAIIKHRHCINGRSIKKVAEIKNHRVAVQGILNFILSPENKIITGKTQIKAVGHRIVHGGKYSAPAVINGEVKKYLVDVTFELAPLHNPYNYQGIEAIEVLLPGVPNVGVFDTAFHQTIPDFAFMYAIPYRYYAKHLIRKYGFHGTSHHYVMERALEMLKIPREKSRIITGHLGNGASLSAIKGGKCVDTSMGFTPLEGVMMGTRCGDIDPAAVLHIMMEEELDIRRMGAVLNRQSGLAGVSGVSNDIREILKSIKAGNERAVLAFEMFCYRIKKYIGSYISVLNGADAVVFTAGAGENSPAVRKEVLKNLENLGIIIDLKKNEEIKNGAGGVISADNSDVKVIVIPTNEELMISLMVDKII
ncbi:MAG: acetate kinase [bacterium]